MFILALMAFEKMKKKHYFHIVFFPLPLLNEKLECLLNVKLRSNTLPSFSTRDPYFSQNLGRKKPLKPGPYKPDYVYVNYKKPFKGRRQKSESCLEETNENGVHSTLKMGH